MAPPESPALDTVLYTPSVVNSLGGIRSDIYRSRDRVTQIARRPVQLEATAKLEALRQRDEEHNQKSVYTHDRMAGPIPKLQLVALEYSEQEMQIGDPTTLILIDEADRLRIASLEQARFDTTTPAGRMMMQMVGAFAFFERSMLKERTKAGLDAAREEGRIGWSASDLSPQQ